MIGLKKRKQRLINDLNNDLNNLYNKIISKSINWKADKSFLQLYCFTLSCLNILKGQLNAQNLEILKKILDIDLKKSLEEKK